MRAEKVDWVDQLPKVLTFQLNRLKFEGGVAKKLLHEVKIEKTFYPDRFLYQNRDEVEEKRLQVKKLRDNIQFLESCLKKFTKFEGSEVSILQALQLSLAFFAKQGTKEVPEMPADFQMLD